MVQLYTFLVRVLADGDLVTTTSHPCYAIELVCERCSCPTATNPGWRGQRSLESCAQTCAQEGSRIKHASGLKSNGDPGDNNCGCCNSLETFDQRVDFGINVYQISTATTHSSTGVTTSHAQSSNSYVIQAICTQCSCPSGETPGWRGFQSLASCAQTCAREGSWFKHASGVKHDGSPGDNNCDCCDDVSSLDPDTYWGINVYQFRSVDSQSYYQRSCADCSCSESTKARTTTRTFDDCAAFCAEQFPRFQYDDTVMVGTCICCLQGTKTSGRGSVYVYHSPRATIKTGAADRSATITVVWLYFALHHW